jgi:hypothetical protein
VDLLPAVEEVELAVEVAVVHPGVAPFAAVGGVETEQPDLADGDGAAIELVVVGALLVGR